MAITILVTTTIDNAEAYTVDPALIANVKSYAAETHHGTDHIERWNRVLHAFGVIQHTSTMTAQEAQTYADKGWNRWIPVVTALTELEKAATNQQQDTTAPVITLQGVSQVTLTVGDTYTDAGAICTDDTDGAISTSDDSANVDTQTPNSYTITYSCTDSSGNIATPVYRTVTVEALPDTTQTPSYTVDPALIADVKSYAAETHHGTDHVERWNRVLDAFGVIQHTSTMTAQEAQTYADKGWNRWIPVVTALTALEQSQQQQDQQGALENPQYTPQQDQLPGTQQSQQQNQAIIDEYRQVKSHAKSLADTLHALHTLAFDDRVENPDVWIQIRDVHAPTTVPANSLGLLVFYGDRYEQNNDFAALSNQITKIKTAIQLAEDVLSQMRAILTNVVYGPLDSCPSQNDLTTNKERTNYIAAEKVFSKRLLASNTDDIPPGKFKEIEHRNPSTGVLTHITYQYTDGTLLHSLTERICAYHDITYNSEWHTNLVKQAMLALGIHPKADNITPMTADEARQMARMYDNSQYTWQNPDDGFPAWKEKLWDDIATKIRNVEHDKHYAENYNEINDQRTDQEECDLPNVVCEYHSAPTHGGFTYTPYVNKQTVYKINDADLRKVTSYDGNIKNIKLYNSQNKLVLHDEYTDNVLTRGRAYDTHNNQITWDAQYNTNGILVNLYTYKWDGMFNRPIVSFTISNGIVTDGSVNYPGSNHYIISRSSGVDSCQQPVITVTMTCTDEHTALFDLDRYNNPISSLYAELWYDENGGMTKIKTYDKGVLELHNEYVYNYPPGDSSYLVEAEEYYLDGQLRSHTKYNAEQKITYYREYYPSGNLFASSNNFDSDNTVINGRIYHDTSDMNNYRVHQSSHGNYNCHLQIPPPNTVSCTPDEISLFKRTFAKLR